MRILNQIIVPCVTTKLAAIEVDKAKLKEWDKILVGVVNCKMGLWRTDSPKYIHLDPEMGGMGLKALTIEVAATQIDTIMHNGIFSNDAHTNQAYKNARNHLQQKIENTFRSGLELGKRKKDVPSIRDAIAGDLGSISVTNNTHTLEMPIAEIVERYMSKQPLPADLDQNIRVRDQVLPILLYLHKRAARNGISRTRANLL